MPFSPGMPKAVTEQVIEEMDVSITCSSLLERKQKRPHRPTRTDCHWQLLKLNIVISDWTSAVLWLQINTISLTWVYNPWAASLSEAAASCGDGSPQPHVGKWHIRAWPSSRAKALRLICHFTTICSVEVTRCKINNFVCVCHQQSSNWTFRENLCHHPTRRSCFKVTALC